MSEYLVCVFTGVFSVRHLISMCFIFQHNALRAICPATVNIVMGIVSYAKANTDVRRTAVNCFVLMIQLLNRCSPDQVSVAVCNEATKNSSKNGSRSLPLSSYCSLLLPSLLSYQPAQSACH